MPLHGGVIDAAVRAEARMATVLGFDFGLARIGVAVGDTELRLAHALTTIAETANAPRFAAIATLLTQWQPARLVVGLPTHADGGDHEMGARCRRFANQLHGRYGLPVDLEDEHLSSAEAEDMLRERGRDWRARKQVLDALAAQRILQTWLDRHATA